MNQTNTGATATGTTTQEQAPQPIESHYTIRADYVGIAIAFFVIGYLLAYKTATAAVASIHLITHTK